MPWHASHDSFLLFLLMYVSCCLDLPTVLSSWEIKWEGLGLGAEGGVVGWDRYKFWEGH